MPSIYAHYRFGCLLLPALPGDVRGAVARHRALFDAGLQGPDFFFFYKPGVKTDIRKLGRKFHYQTGREFFTRVCRTLHSDSDEAELVYLYGLLGHYCLDSVCHPFIHEHTDGGNPGHSALESEFDRHLLTLDGCKKPHIYPRSRCMRLRREQIPIVSRFYPPATTEQVRDAIASMGTVTSLITCGNPVHRAAAKAVLRTLGTDQPGLLVPPAPDPVCRALDEPMAALFDRALARYPQMLEDLRDHLTFREPLGEEFDPIFG